jgi:hypothetical protein
MNHFLYFIPNIVSVSLSNQAGIYEKAGLSKTLEGTHAKFRGCPKFTEGGETLGGCTFITAPLGVNFDDVSVANVAYQPDVQTWLKHPSGAFWVGYYNAKIPRPEDLERREIIDGHKVLMLDGSEWTIPLARDFTGQGTQLTQAYGWGPDGEEVKEIIPKFRGFSERIGKIWKKTIDDNKYYEEDCKPVAIEALQINYRIGQAELYLLGLLNTGNIFDIVRAACDEPGLEKWLEDKKKDDLTESNSPSTDGDPD